MVYTSLTTLASIIDSLVAAFLPGLCLCFHDSSRTTREQLRARSDSFIFSRFVCALPLYKTGTGHSVAHNILSRSVFQGIFSLSTPCPPSHLCGKAAGDACPTFLAANCAYIHVYSILRGRYFWTCTPYVSWAGLADSCTESTLA